MGQLELLLDKVRKSDLENFRVKVEAMEAPHEQYRQDMGIEGIEEIIRTKEMSIENRVLEVSSVSLYDSEAKQQMSKPIEQSNVPGGEDIFNKFLESIKG